MEANKESDSPTSSSVPLPEGGQNSLLKLSVGVTEQEEKAHQCVPCFPPATFSIPQLPRNQSLCCVLQRENLSRAYCAINSPETSLESCGGMVMQGCRKSECPRTLGDKRLGCCSGLLFCLPHPKASFLWG